ncbi:hypothetical protein AHMF7605_11295 [Adhaeribacter arboris]|uniref:Uncharacterized protein n=1 Tax=Adhaeribacter arboris TaxID=2072846 RepID=A0A2T2YEZ9_9BACT|nr:hypothetical protein [Adhaeribacter arboris]PSR54063.1 hypothetical protein AHMF7605_11295 [Adhaeribacter arboris]
MLQIKEYVTEPDNTFYIVAQVKTNEDALLLQSIFRDALFANKSIVSFFGLNEDLQDVLAFTYPINRLFKLVHVGQGKNMNLELLPLSPSSGPNH